VYNKIEIKKEDIAQADKAQELIMPTVDGKFYRLIDIGLMVKSNAGIAITWDINPALDLMHKHAKGPIVSDKLTED
jgi:hypothetical protein